MPSVKKKLLWVGDAVTQTGFARVTHNVLKHLCETWEVAVLGVNYNGDPHQYPYRIFPAMNGGDVWGVGRIAEIVNGFKPDVVLVLQDPWNIMPYLDRLTEAKLTVPVVAYMPVDAPNQRSGKQLYEMGLTRAITYTEFGQHELVLSGWTGRTNVIPHGVDTELYKPMDRQEARDKLTLSAKLPKNAFIVGNINRNQPRKRLDLTIMHWAQWWYNLGQPSHTYLYLHCSNHDIGWDVLQLAKYYGIDRNIIITNPNMRPDLMLAESNMPLIYAALDVQVSTTLGEGWGLTTHEGMACATPQIVPEYAALGEWAEGAVRFVPCTSHAVHLQGINTIGGVVDPAGFIEALDELYGSEARRDELGQLALRRATERRFTWQAVAAEFDRVLSETVHQADRKPVGIERK